MIQLLLSARTTINRTTPIWLPKIIVPSTILLIVAIPLTAVIIASMMGPSPAGTAIGTAIGGGGGIGVESGGRQGAGGTGTAVNPEIPKGGRWSSE